MKLTSSWSSITNMILINYPSFCIDRCTEGPYAIGSGH